MLCARFFERWLSLSQVLNKVFLSKNMQRKLTKDFWAFNQRYSNNNTKSYSKQYMGRKNTNTGQNFTPKVALNGLSETGPWLQNVAQKIEEMIPIHFKNKMETSGF